MVSPELQVAVDVGSQCHRVAIGDAEGRLLEEFDVEHTAAGLSGFFTRVERVRARCGWPVAVAMEGHNGWARPLDRQVLLRGWRFCDRIAVLLHFCYTAAMKTTLTVTRRGVVTLPAKLRRALGIKADDQLIAETTPEGLLLRPAVTLPIEMYSEKRVREFDQAEAQLEQVLRSKRKLKSAR